MNEDAEDCLLDRLKTEFGHNEGDAVTASLRREYLEALNENAVATSEYDNAIKGPEMQRIAPGQHSAVDGVLTASLKLRQQQRENSQLGIIEHYHRELTEASHKPPHDPSTILSLEEGLEGLDKIELASKFEAAEALLRKLEHAVITAKRETDIQRHRLETARAASPFQASQVQQAHALTTVHDDLTRWLENSLALCASDTPVSHDKSDATKAGCLTTKHVQEAYEQYVEARGELIRAVDTLSTNKQKYETRLMASPGKQQIRPIQDVLLDSGNDLLKAFRATGRDRLYQYAHNEIEAEQATTIERLRRLADESQLLTAYPLLAGSGKADQVIAPAIGRKASDTEDQVARQMEAWDFAAGVAGEVTGKAVGRHVAAAYGATESAQGNLEDLRRLHDLTNFRG